MLGLKSIHVSKRRPMCFLIELEYNMCVEMHLFASVNSMFGE